MLWLIVSNINKLGLIIGYALLAVELINKTNKCVKRKCLYEYSIILTTYDNISFEEQLKCTECPITLNTFQKDTKIALIPTCRHIFEEDALYKWVDDEHFTCPLCRDQII
jgi:hypothetical protein